MKKLISGIVISILLAYSLQVSIPSDHLAASNKTFLTIKSVVALLNTAILFLSDNTKYDVFKTVWRDLLSLQPEDTSGMEIKTIEVKGFSIVHVVPDIIKEEKSRKTLFYYHGGGMVAGSAYSFPIQFVKERKDVQVFSVDYRFAPEVPFPGPVNDCIEGTRFVLGDKEKYRVVEQIHSDAQKVVVRH